MLKALWKAATEALKDKLPSKKADKKYEEAVRSIYKVLDVFGPRYLDQIEASEFYEAVKKALEGTNTDPVDDFAARHQGTSVGSSQSPDLIVRYIQRVSASGWKWPNLVSAKDLWYDNSLVDSGLWERIEYWQKPQKGDIVVYDGNVGWGHGTVGVFIEEKGDHIVMFTQNPSKAGPWLMPKQGISGFFRLKTPKNDEKGQK